MCARVERQDAGGHRTSSRDHGSSTRSHAIEPRIVPVTRAIEADVQSSAATAARAQYRRGALLVAGGALAWSISGLIVRTTSTDAWSTLFWRSVFACLFLFAYVALRDRGRAIAGFRKLGLPGLGVALSFAISMGSFILA